MELIYFIGGILLGVICTLICKSRERIDGVIDVDHNTDQCRFSIVSDQLTKRDKKIAVFYINHNAEISRDKQGL